MSAAKIKQTLQDLLTPVGITINGSEPYDIQIHNEAFYQRLIAGSSLALGESYMDGWWNCQQLDALFYKILNHNLDTHIKKNLSVWWLAFKAAVLNAQKLSRAYTIGRHHYDIGNDLFNLMLDKRLNYSCAYWKNAATLDEAQEAKLDLICRKMGLKRGMRVLDIGCGWGSFAQYAAEKYGVSVYGITVSEKQVKLAQERTKDLDVTIVLSDYRKLNQTFDRIISIGMFEHVGYKNYRTYMEVVNRCLADDGLFLLHTIGANISVHLTEPWIGKYIFPNSIF